MRSPAIIRSARRHCPHRVEFAPGRLVPTDVHRDNQLGWAFEVPGQQSRTARVSDAYRVNLDVFTGPLDLLLYLIRRDEVDIQDIPIARVTEQYLDHIHLLEQLDPDGIADFLVMASTLVELKSRSLLPTAPVEAADDDDPRAPLVRQLLEYKRFKDAANALGSAADDRARRYVRKPANLPRDLQGVELEEAQVWDLLSAFGQVMAAVGRGPGQHEVRYDDTPIELHVAEVVAILEREGPQTFQGLFDGQHTRMQIVGRFLALLELVRRHRIRAEQEKTFGTIYMFLLEEVTEDEAAGDGDADTPHTTNSDEQSEDKEADDEPTE
jgi:segregation and condensation protein A